MAQKPETMIDQQTIERILDAAHIEEVVSEFVTLKKRGVNLVGLCPFHNDKTPSFYVSPTKGLCKCFACGKGGNAVHFVMQHEQMSYPDALRWLAKKYHIEIQEKELTAEQRALQGERESLLVVNEYAMQYFRQTLRTHADGKSIALAYFRSRGIRDDIAEKFRLGYCTSQKDAFASEAIRKGYRREYLLKTGLCYEKEDGSIRVDYAIGKIEKIFMMPTAITKERYDVFVEQMKSSTKKKLSSNYTLYKPEELDKKKIVLVTGFQGINKYDDITTLGRGGSDTSAVAIAAAGCERSADKQRCQQEGKLFFHDMILLS